MINECVRLFWSIKRQLERLIKNIWITVKNYMDFSILRRFKDLLNQCLNKILF